ncbi:hypothetical protein NG799_25700 [Laspinema sp. D1]|uniref:Uncharacterized protein n=1 Tax=Laspinema palackyanum D2a TaxID=2953684 RepID=A0ABT2N1W0_9CYAN|nr:hypothetical protein [Laspinema sp. D2a]
MKIIKSAESDFEKPVSPFHNHQQIPENRKLPALVVTSCCGVILVLGVCAIFSPDFRGMLILKLGPIEFLLDRQIPNQGE